MKKIIFTKAMEKLIASKLKLKKRKENYDLMYIPYLYPMKIKEGKIDKINYNNLLEIREYVDALEEFLTPKEKIIFYNKLKTLKVMKDNWIIVDGDLGVYYPRKNTIKYFLKSSIGHELLHMSSSYCYKKFYVSGFRISAKNKRIGIGLNEGYTELLATRFFKLNGKPDTYQLLVKLTKQLESFFDNKEDMRKLYFDHDLLGFIFYMEKYAPEKEILNLISQMDKMILVRAYAPIMEYVIYNKLKKQLNEWYKIKEDKVKKIY